VGGIYRSPLRVYLVLGLLSLIGVWSAFQLPISLFPNSSKPQVSMCINTNLSPDAFLSTYGTWIEEQLRAIRRDSLQVEKVSASYRPKDACYDIDFKWGGDPSQALREVEAVSNAVQGRLPQESRDRVSVFTNRENGGFLALSFYSSKRSLTELYNTLEPVLTPKVSRVQDAQDVFLFNPQQRQLLIELKPEQLAALQLFPNDIASAVLRALDSYGGGSLTVDSTNLRIEFPRPVKTLDDFKLIQVPTSSGRAVTLGEIAHLDLTVPLDSTRIFKTSGMSSVILMAFPKPGGNVKSMAEDVMKAVKETMPSLPSDIQYSSLVDPSEFIRSAVTNVTHEVGLSAFLAVVILFLFVGNLKNVVTAAIEIPLSIVLAFILMKLTGMNLNLISLGGLALSAGMNVDASVVVMENIFRHFEARHGQNHDQKLSFEERLQVIITAVREVQFSVIASTIASLVVFIPLAFTSELSNAILGDLAKAVVFSHGFSAVVALVLVPTIRLQMMKDGAKAEAPSLFEKPLTWIEQSYARSLGWFLERASVKLAAYAGLSVLLALLIGFVIPRLPKEIIGKPDTDWLILGISTNGNTVVRQMEAQTEAVENELLTKFGDKILYTFTQIQRPNNSNIMFRLRDKRDMTEILKGVEETFTNTPLTSYWSDSWNPAELPLPDPADFEVSIRGSDNKAMAETARDIYNELQEKKLFSRVRVNPNAWADKSVIVRPKMEQWQLLANQGVPISIASLADLTRTATVGRPVIKTEIENETMDVFMRFSENYVVSPEDLAALPIGVGSRIVPLKALAEVTREEGDLPVFRENGRRLFSLQARVKKDELSQKDSIVASAAEVVTHWPNRKMPQAASEAGPNLEKSEPKQVPTLQIEDSQKELHDALKQLVTAVSLSIVLIFLTMVFQFGSLVNSLLVLVAVPLGFVGVILSLWLFRSTLSLNSMLGVILLNGLAVANSIILVDFLQRAVKAGQSPKQAAVDVARTRLRPILMTSMTTGLGMLPVALGLGEGGKILQPLGIAVAGGLGFSMITTLFVVPALQVSWLEFREKRSPSAIPAAASIVASLLFALCLPWNANAQGMSSAKSGAEAKAKDAFLVKPQLESAEGLSFADAWTQILDRSLRLETQKLEVETSSARRLQTIGGFLPSVALKGTESTSGEPFSGPRRSASVEANLNVFRSGGDLASLSAASKDLASAKYRLESERQAAQLDAAAALFTVIARTQQTRIYETIVKLKTESFRVARERFASGLLPQQEVDKVAVELENAKARAIDAGTSEADARARLKALLGQDTIAIVWPWKQNLIADPRLEETEFKLEARPDWQAAHATTDAESARKRAALARFFPSLDLSLSYGNADLTDPSRRDWAAMATLSIPLFERLTSFAGYKIQSQALKVAQVREESVTREAGPEVEASRLSFRAARTSALARDKTAKLSEKLFDDNFQRFRLGRATVNELAFDQNRLFESELLAVDGWLSAHTAFVRLCHALGHQMTASGSCVQSPAR
jgi:multidrug efflux pump subunit AcrB/outer membrane protein TolC